MRASYLALCVALAFAAGAQAQTVYKWVDKDGKVHFGDAPPSDQDARAQRIRGGGDSPLHDDVGRLEIAMDDPLRMGGVQGIGDLPGNHERFDEREWSVRKGVSQRRTFDELQDQRREPVAFFEAVNRADMRVAEGRQDAGFACKSGAALRVCREPSV